MVSKVSKGTFTSLKRLPQKNYNRILLGLVLTFPLLFFAELMQGSILYDISGLLAIVGVFMILLNLYTGMRKSKKKE